MDLVHNNRSSITKNIYVKNRIRDQFVTNWRSDVFESDSCVIYRMFKDEFKESAYIKILPKFIVQQMTRSNLDT